MRGRNPKRTAPIRITAIPCNFRFRRRSPSRSCSYEPPCVVCLPLWKTNNTVLRLFQLIHARIPFGGQGNHENHPFKVLSMYVWCQEKGNASRPTHQICRMLYPQWDTTLPKCAVLRENKLKLSNIVGGNVCVLLLRFHVRWFLPLACRAPSGRRNLCRKASHHMAYTHVYRSYRGSVKRPSPSPTNGIEQESCHCSSSVDMLTMPPYRRICLLSKERPLPDSGAGIQSSVLVVPLVWDSKTLSSVSLM